MTEEKDVLIPVRDGVRMAARIYRPEGTGPFPALFATSPYRYDNNELPAQPIYHDVAHSSQLVVPVLTAD